MINWLPNIIKKYIKKYMDISMLNNLKQQYIGKYFKWTRPVSHETMGNMIEVGDIVRCVNVRLRESDKTVLAEFHMGPPIAVNLLHSHLEPYNSDSIVTPTDNQYDSMGMDRPANPNSMMMSEADKLKFMTNGNTQPSASVPTTQQAASANNMLFEKFSTDEIRLDIGLRIKMPNVQLVQMMYTSAADKEEFISDLSAFVMSKITTDNIKTSLLTLMGIVQDHNTGQEIVSVDTDSQ